MECDLLVIGSGAAGLCAAVTAAASGLEVIVAERAPVLPPARAAAAAPGLLPNRPAPLIAPRALAEAAAGQAPRPTDHPLDLFALTSRPAPTRAMGA